MNDPHVNKLVGADIVMDFYIISKKWHSLKCSNVLHMKEANDNFIRCGQEMCNRKTQPPHASETEEQRKSQSIEATESRINRYTP
jgi:hypothetical protein